MKYIPDRLKYSEVKPLFKKGEKNINFILPSHFTSTFLFRDYRKNYLQKINLLLTWK